ncbi:MAG: Trm112 family protein [Shewanellaceae bacterium]|nr:Trm112 family protein [Shewanellaceae bacterium]
MIFDTKLLSIIVCPVCKGQLEYAKTQDSLLCHFDKVSFPIDEGIPVLLEHRAVPFVNNS